MAAGLVPFALGSETSGSILTPAAFCGVTGLRPTYGLVSRHGAMALSWTMDKIGPLCRSAEDCALVLEVIAGGDAADPGSAHKSFYYTPQYYRKPKDLRIGYAPVDFAEWAQPSARPAFEQALAVIRETGAQLIETKLPDLPYRELTSTIILLGRRVHLRAADCERKDGRTRRPQADRRPQSRHSTFRPGII